MEAAGIEGAARCGPCAALGGPAWPCPLGRASLAPRRRDPRWPCMALRGTATCPNLSYAPGQRSDHDCPRPAWERSSSSEGPSIQRRLRARSRCALGSRSLRATATPHERAAPRGAGPAPASGLGRWRAGSPVRPARAARSRARVRALCCPDHCPTTRAAMSASRAEARPPAQRDPAGARPSQAAQTPSAPRRPGPTSDPFPVTLRSPA